MPKTAKSLAMLFVGNSFTNRNDLPGLLVRLASAAQPPRKLVTERVIANGMSLKTHWDRGIATKMIRERCWDYVVLQDQSTMGLKNPARLKEYAAKFDSECRSGRLGLGDGSLLHPIQDEPRDVWLKLRRISTKYTSLNDFWLISEPIYNSRQNRNLRHSVGVADFRQS